MQQRWQPTSLPAAQAVYWCSRIHPLSSGFSWTLAQLIPSSLIWPAIMAADCIPISCWGSCKQTLTPSGQKSSWSFLMAAVAFPILGADFLEDFDLEVDWYVPTASTCCCPLPPPWVPNCFPRGGSSGLLQGALLHLYRLYSWWPPKAVPQCGSGGGFSFTFSGLLFTFSGLLFTFSGLLFTFSGPSSWWPLPGPPQAASPASAPSHHATTGWLLASLKRPRRSSWRWRPRESSGRPKAVGLHHFTWWKKLMARGTPAVTSGSST